MPVSHGGPMLVLAIPMAALFVAGAVTVSQTDCPPGGAGALRRRPATGALAHRLALPGHGGAPGRLHAVVARAAGAWARNCFGPAWRRLRRPAMVAAAQWACAGLGAISAMIAFAGADRAASAALPPGRLAPWAPWWGGAVPRVAAARRDPAPPRAHGARNLCRFYWT